MFVLSERKANSKAQANRAGQNRIQGGARGQWPPSPVEIDLSHKKDGHQRWPHIFHVSCPPHPAAGSDATGSLWRGAGGGFTKDMNSLFAPYL